MLWLASYPRSGNTFFRIVLDEVYGIESSTFHREADYPLDANYASFPVVKTHLLPNELRPDNSSIPAVYLVRDGRDCVVSLAHYRRMLIDGTSDFETNLLAAIDAVGGSHFGGWSQHVERWLPRASVVLRFEDLIADPIACIEQLRPFVDLPKPRVDRLPSFRDLQSSDFRYGSGVSHGFEESERAKWRTAKFRRGRSGGWEHEMPEQLHQRFLHRHGTQLQELGYIKPVAVPALRKPPVPTVRTARARPRRRKVMIDAAKLLDTRMDGIRRYVQELLIAMLPMAEAQPDRWDIDVYFGVNGTFPLLAIREELEKGEPPLEAMPQRMTIAECRERLQQLKGQFTGQRFRESIRYGSLKLHRSIQKRLLACKEFGAMYGGWLRSSTKKKAYDLIHHTLPNTWSPYPDVGIPRMVTVHDLCHLVCPEFQNASNVRTLARGLQSAEHGRSGYIAVSQSTAAQMVELLSTDPNRIRVIHEGCSRSRFQPGMHADEWHRIQQKYNVPQSPYFLSVGTVEPRKNLVATVKAFRLMLERHPDLNTQLLIVGANGWGDADELGELVSTTPQIRRLGYVPDEELPALYMHAAAFCYVSHYEGFGLPLLEAMNCGTPTIYGDNSAMPEIAAESGVPAESNDLKGIARAMEALAYDASLRERLGRNAVLRASEFTWQKTATETLESYEEFISAGRFTTRPYSGDVSNFTNSIHPSGKEDRRAVA